MKMSTLIQTACLILSLLPASAGWAQSACGPGAAQCSSKATDKPMAKTANIVGGALTVCSRDPMTGWFRDGSCKTNAQDRGRHVVCAVMTESFLTFTRSRGNDLSTPRPQLRFPGLKPNDRWCLCALRWREAQEAGFAPPVVTNATHKNALKYVVKTTLLKHAVKPPSAPSEIK